MYQFIKGEDKVMAKERVILIVDDDPTVLRVQSEIFRDIYHVKIATSGKDAITIASIDDIDLVLLDVNLPDMNGLEVCSTFKKNDTTKKIPIIFVTAEHDTILEDAGIDIGASDFITKPFSSALLKARVKAHIQVKVLQEKLEQIAMTDSLTGLSNKRFFDITIDKEWRRHTINGDTLSFLLLDIDYFKLIIDKYGHEIGNQTLKITAAMLSKYCKRPYDLAVRMSNDEFSIILTETDSNNASYIAEMIRKHFESIPFYSNDGEKYGLTVSIGVNTIKPSKTDNLALFINNAHRLLEEAKNRGRNQVKVGIMHSNDNDYQEAG